ncbi:MAG TPA: HEAT repeat domain-containing protein, partial [Planctomycetota bacterium]|nr:HEAT repeat domain-containing protein [Planctomycetota bacterium]
MRPHLLPLLLVACAGPDTAPSQTPPAAQPPVDLATASRDDFIERLAERLASSEREQTPELMNSIEQLIPAWQGEQRANRAQPIENVVSIKVIVHFDQVLESFQGPDRNRRLVAAWALGFSRVPENTRGIVSPHPRAVAALVAALEERDDELLRNELLALWKLGDPEVPIAPLLDLLVQHHDADVRSSAALALQTVLTARTAPLATDAVQVAFSDADAKVRLHATSIARRFPQPATTARLQELLGVESSPLVRANIALALGAAGARPAGPALVVMLRSPQEIEATSARQALALL